MSESDKAGFNSKLIGKIKDFLNSKFGEFIVLAALSALGLIFTVIYYSAHFTAFEGTNRADLSLWTADFFQFQSAQMPKLTYIANLNIYFIVAFVVCVVLHAVAALVMFFKKDKRLFYVTAISNIVLSVVTLIFGLLFGILRGGTVACCVISMLIGGLTLAFLFLRRKHKYASVAVDTATEKEQSPLPPEKRKKYKLILLICECVALFFTFIVFLVPLYSEVAPTATAYILITAFSSYSSLYMSIVSLAAFIAFFGEIVYFTSTVIAYNKSTDVFFKESKRFMLGATIFTLIFFVAGYCFSFFNNLYDGPQRAFSTVSYIPFILSVVVLVIYSVFAGKLGVEGIFSHKAKRKALKIEPLIVALAMTAVTFVSLALNIVKIHIAGGEFFVNEFSLTGYQLLSSYRGLEAGFQTLAFFEFAFLLSSGLLLVFSVVGYFAKDDGYYKIIKTSVVANFVFVLLIGLFGIYFQIVQKINIENITSLLKQNNIELPETYTYDVTSQTIYMLIASVAIIVYILLRKTLAVNAENGAGIDAAQSAPVAAAISDASTVEPITAATPPDFDACPAFTELDGKQAQFVAQLEERRKQLFQNPTLPNIVRFVVDYARECRLHLSYSPEDIATFVAGLGASRLAILQGMSGTGKTSLPKVFTEALMGNCEIVEVESSWRDKNELLGYYNEFSKCFTPKKFTQCLYKARLNPTVVTFIVLDEMNLSRIEYYFSDFLSLMEHEEDKREIKLLNVKLHRIEGGQKIPYDGLTDGHTIKIPANVWFIGTANRDESTFEISDKVYDRAQTMNFNKRAPKINSFSEPLGQRFIEYDTLVKLFNEAKAGYEFDAESNVLVQKTEKLLAPYNISFGNRILRQMEDFVKIYCACFGDKSAVENDAVEQILLSKVVSKLERKVVENKEALATDFDKIGLKNCGAFVRKLNED